MFTAVRAIWLPGRRGYVGSQPLRCTAGSSSRRSVAAGMPSISCKVRASPTKEDSAMTASTYSKPLPEITEENRPYWESAKAHRLALQRCTNCGKFRLPISTFCPNCLSDATEWTPVSGRGTVYSFVIMHQVYRPAFRAEVPYNVAAIEFEEGPRVYSNIVGCPNDQIKVG